MFMTLYVLVFIAHGRRELVHVNVTARPTAAWVWRQVIEATPWGRRPRHLPRDRDAPPRVPRPPHHRRREPPPVGARRIRGYYNSERPHRTLGLQTPEETHAHSPARSARARSSTGCTTPTNAPPEQADVLPSDNPYLRLPLQFSVSLEPRLLRLVSPAELVRLRQAAETEIADPSRWGTPFTLIQTWAKVPRSS
jgi:hypothetical protein